MKSNKVDKLHKLSNKMWLLQNYIEELERNPEEIKELLPKIKEAFEASALALKQEKDQSSK